MNLIRIVRWVAAKHPSCPQSAQTTVELASGWVRLGRHFKGSGTWGVQVNFRGVAYLNLRRLPVKVAPRFILTARCGFGFLQIAKPTNDAYRAVVVVSDRAFGLA